MNAPDAPGLLACCIDRIGCSFICGLMQPHTLRAPMKSADSLLICRTSYALKLSFRLSEFRSDLSCHHARLPTQPFDVILQASIFHTVLLIKPVVH